MLLVLFLPTISLLALPCHTAISRDGDFSLDVRAQETIVGGPYSIEWSIQYRGQQVAYTYDLGAGSDLEINVIQKGRKLSIPGTPASEASVFKWVVNGSDGRKLYLGSRISTRAQMLQKNAIQPVLEPGFAQLSVKVSLRRPQYGGNGLTIIDVAKLSVDVVVFISPRMVARLPELRHNKWQLLLESVDNWFDGFDARSLDSFRELQNNSDVWVRTFTYLKYGEPANPAWRRQLLFDLEGFTTMIDETATRALVRDLDSPRFAARVAARKELEKRALQIDVWLRKIRAEKLSNEADHQIDLLLKKVESSDAKNRSRLALQNLESVVDALNPEPGDPVVQVLQALARPKSICTSCVEAERVLLKVKPANLP